MYLEDLSHATEVVLTGGRRVRLSEQPEPRRRRSEGLAHGSGGRAAAGALGVGSAVGAAISNHRVLGPAEARVMASAGLLLLAVSGVAAMWPKVVAIPLGSDARMGGTLAVLKSRHAELSAEGRAPAVRRLVRPDGSSRHLTFGRFKARHGADLLDEPSLNRWQHTVQPCFTPALREGPASDARFHNEDQPPPNSCVRFPFTSDKPRTTAPVARLFQRPAGGYASSDGATSSQAPRTTFTQRNGRETSHIAMVARLATMGPMIRSFARAGSAYRVRGRHHQPDASESREQVLPHDLRAGWRSAPRSSSVPKTHARATCPRPRPASDAGGSRGIHPSPARSSSVTRLPTQGTACTTHRTDGLEHDEHHTDDTERADGEAEHNHDPRHRSPARAATDGAGDGIHKVADRTECGVRDWQDIGNL